MKHRYRRKALTLCLALAVILVTPGVAPAGGDKANPEENAVTEPESAVAEHEITEVLSSLPVLGTGLNVTITRGEDGEIAAVALDPADGSTVVKESDHKMVFLLGDGDTEVVVKVRRNTIQTQVKADATADVTGPGSWSADVFGNGAVTIPYTVSFEGNAPIITLGEIVTPEGVTAEAGEPRAGVSDDGAKAFYKIKVRLASGEERAKVTLVAKTYVDDDGEVKVRFAVSVSDRSRHKHWDDDDDRRNWDRDDDRDKGDRDDESNRDGDHDDQEQSRDRDHDGDDGERDRDDG
ncbi:MAG TPA: hypothetical protein VF083_13905 [Acidimicrobiia bacterium]